MILFLAINRFYHSLYKVIDCQGVCIIITETLWSPPPTQHEMHSMSSAHRARPRTPISAEIAFQTPPFMQIHTELLCLKGATKFCTSVKKTPSLPPYRFIYFFLFSLPPSFSFFYFLPCIHIIHSHSLFRIRG